MQPNPRGPGDPDPDFARRAQASNRHSVTVYLVASIVSAVLLPTSLHSAFVAWVMVGVLVLALHRITPPDERSTERAFWWQHLMMAMSWPVLLYWIHVRGARVHPRTPWDPPRAP